MKYKLIDFLCFSIPTRFFHRMKGKIFCSQKDDHAEIPRAENS